MFKQTTIEDSRGRRINFLVDLDWSATGLKLSKEDQITLTKVFMDDIQGTPANLKLTAHLGPREYLFLLGATIPFVVAAVGTSFLPQSGSTWLKEALHLVIFVSCMVLWSILLVKWRCRSLNQERPFPQAAMSFGHCPACLYDLQQLAPDESDGCTVCPECGGAWKLP